MDTDCTDEELMEIYGTKLSWEEMKFVDSQDQIDNFFNFNPDEYMGASEYDLGCIPAVIKTKVGEELTFTRPQPTIPEESEEYRNPYTYKCEFSQLLRIQQGIVAGRPERNVGPVFKYLNSPLNLEVFGQPGFNCDVVTDGIHKLEREILDSNFLFEGVRHIQHVLNPTLGCVKALVRKAQMHVALHYVIDSTWDESRIQKEEKELANIVAYCHAKGRLSPTKYATFKALPDHFYYVGYSSHLLHERRVKGVGYEFNPVAGYSVKVPILSVQEYSDHYVVQYVKKGSKWTAKYYKQPGAFRYNASVLTSPKIRIDHSAAINMVSTKVLITSTQVRVTDNYFFANCYDRLVRPVYTHVKEFKTSLGKTLVGMYDVDNKSYPSLMLYPPVEAKWSDHILRTEVPDYKEFNYTYGDYMVRSTLSHAVCHFQIKSKKPVKYSKADLGFPSVWYYCGGVWRLRAYPEYSHEVIRGHGVPDQHRMLHDGVDVALPLGVGPDGFYNIPKNAFVLAGPVTYLYLPDELGDAYSVGDMPVVKDVATSQVFLRRRVDIKGDIVHYPASSDAIRKEIYTNCFMYDFPTIAAAKKFSRLHKGDVLRNAWRKLDMGIPLNGYKALWQFAHYNSESIYAVSKPFVGLTATDGLEIDSYYKSSTYYEQRYSHSVSDSTGYDSGKDLVYPSVPLEIKGGLFGQ